MAFVFLYTKDGSTPQTKYYKMADVSVTKGEILYGASGYATNATANSCNTDSVLGVAEATVDNSGASGYSIPIQVNRNAVFKVGTADTMAQDYVGTNVNLATTTTITSNTAKTDEDGVIKIEKHISASSAEVSINYATPGAE